MKKKLLLMLLALVVVMISCNKQSADDAPIGDSVTFSLSTEYEIEVKSGATRSSGLTRYIVEIYEGTDLAATPIYEKEHSNSTFTVSLDGNLTYTCLFWADKGTADDNASGTFNASSLQDVRLNAGQKMKEAFFAKYDMESFSTSTHSIELKRSMAQVNLISSVPTINGTIVATHNAYSQFNVSSGAVLGSNVALADTLNVTADNDTLGSFLTFASVVGIKSDFGFVLGGAVNSSVADVPLKANYITNIKGKFSFQDNDFNVVVQYAWDGEINIPLGGIDLIEIPDAIFKAYLVEHFDIDGDSEISIEEALLVNDIRCGVNFSPNIQSLEGIEYFVNLTSLDCGYNSLTSLDVSKNIELTLLLCNFNSIPRLDLSNNTRLVYFDCAWNGMTDLNVSKNTELTTLWCQANSLAKIDISGATKLTRIKCQTNSLTSLDLSNNTSLFLAECHDNPSLTTIVMKTGQNISTTFSKPSHTTITRVD